jgi:hypothetical protein
MRALPSRFFKIHCAVDPKKIPYGSKIVLPDDQLIAVDYRSRCFPTRRRATMRPYGRTT